MSLTALIGIEKPTPEFAPVVVRRGEQMRIG
jgi:hypothetical protein